MPVAGRLYISVYGLTDAITSALIQWLHGGMFMKHRRTCRMIQNVPQADAQGTMQW